ncbi:MAG TPA: nucleotidyltransferase domain-containing protein [Drouetiella sp.]
MTPEETAKEILEEKFSDASVLLLAGSIVRGEGTRFSDLDLVVVYDNVERAWRESFLFRGWPVEAFVHDEETLNYFCHKIDAASAFASLPQMIIEGIVIKDTADLAAKLKDMARSIIEQGPPKLDSNDLNKRRYHITDLIDDMREPRSSAELMATGAQLLDVLGDFYLRANNMWSASGKTMFRKLAVADPQIEHQFQSAFHELFANANQAACIQLAEQIVQPHGGLLFDGFKSEAPPEWRLATVSANHD